MPSRRRVFKKRRMFKRRGARLATKKFVKQQIHKQIETKYFSVPFATGQVTVTGTFGSLHNIPQGTTDVTRVGDKLNLRSIYLSYDAIAGIQSCNLRVLVVQWKPIDSFYPITGPSDFFYNTNASAVTISPYVHDYQTSYTVIYDRTHKLIINTESDSVIVKNKRLKIKWAKKQLNYLSATTDGAYKFYIMFVSNTTTDNPSVTWSARTYYDDA